MLVAFTRGLRFRIALAMAAFAAFAFVAPPLAVAFAPAEHGVYCLTHNDHAMGQEHEDGIAGQSKHSHDGSAHKSQCCGLFCVTALAPEMRQGWNPVVLSPEPFSGIEPSFHSRFTELHYRPPITRLPS